MQAAVHIRTLSILIFEITPLAPLTCVAHASMHDHMPVMVQIRNVPSDLHRELKARAALEGISFSDYLLRELRHALDRPTLDEMRKRLSRRQPVQPRPAPAAAVRAARNSR